MEYKVLYLYFWWTKKAFTAFWLIKKDLILCHVITLHYVHLSDGDLKQPFYFFDRIEEFMNDNNV